MLERRSAACVHPAQQILAVVSGIRATHVYASFRAITSSGISRTVSATMTFPVLRKNASISGRASSG